MPRVYQLDPGRYANYWRRQIVTLGVIYALTMAGLLLIAVYAFGDNSERLGFILVVGGITIVTTAKMQISRFRRERDEWLTFKLVLEDDRITQHSGKNPPLVLDRGSVSAIMTYRSGAVTLHADGKIIHVRPDLE